MFCAIGSIPLFVGVFEVADALSKRLWGYTHYRRQRRWSRLLGDL
jgi:hypothetical protein